ncbi:MAG TPA: hypothetical protein VGD94_15380 [Vicinamibacterales bacterium]
MKVSRYADEPVADAAQAAAGAAALAELEAEIASVDQAEKNRREAVERDRAIRQAVQMGTDAEAELRRLRGQLTTLDGALAAMSKVAKAITTIPDGVQGARPTVVLGSDRVGLADIDDIAEFLGDVVDASVPRIQERRGRIASAIEKYEQQLADAQARARELRR